MHGAVWILGALEVREQAGKPLLEARYVARCEARVQDRRGLLVEPRGDELVGSLTEHRRGDRVSPEVVGHRVVGLEHEQAGDPAVVHLGERADLPRPHDPDETCSLEHLQVMSDRSLRRLQHARELGRAGRALPQERDDPSAEGIRERAQLLRLVDDEDVVEVVVGVTVDDRGTYGISPTIRKTSRSAPSSHYAPRRGAIVVEATRGDIVEARHRAHAVAVAGGAIVASAGDAELVTHFRSSAKPIQALPLLRARADLAETEIAIACASHLARPEQLAAVRSLLAKAPAGEDDLECGTRGADAGPTRIEHNCSGKHAGMLALCRARGWPPRGTGCSSIRASRSCSTRSPLRRRWILRRSRSVSTAAASPPSPFRSSGWRTPSRASPISRAGRSDGCDARAPELIRGPLAADTMLMQTQPGWVAKGGAEGLLCAVSPTVSELRSRSRTEARRAVRSALAAFLGRLGVDSGELGEVPIENSRGELVGELRAV